jgi:hypothetical protein
MDFIAGQRAKKMHASTAGDILSKAIIEMKSGDDLDIIADNLKEMNVLWAIAKYDRLMGQYKIKHNDGAGEYVYESFRKCLGRIFWYINRTDPKDLNISSKSMQFFLTLFNMREWSNDVDTRLSRGLERRLRARQIEEAGLPLNSNATDTKKRRHIDDSESESDQNESESDRNVRGNKESIADAIIDELKRKKLTDTEIQNLMRDLSI